VLNLDELGRPLTFRSALAGPHRDQWRRGNGDELIKLVETTRALTPVHFATSSPTYLNNVVKEKWSPAALPRSGDHRDLASDVDRRVRGTAGGDRLAALLPYSVSTATASHPTLNCLLNSVVSDHALFGSIDLTDFYLGIHNPSPQFLKIYLADYPCSVVARLRLQPFLKLDRHGKSFVILRIDKTLYGLKEAGKLSHLRLVQLLLSYDFVETSTLCLFRHKTRPITFCLVVDDFGVKYQHPADFDFLVICLSNLYHPLQGPSHCPQIFRFHHSARPHSPQSLPFLPRVHRCPADPPTPQRRQKLSETVHLHPAPLRFVRPSIPHC
jgi:hypothetical protein